jgi:hypothetical protein
MPLINKHLGQEEYMAIDIQLFEDGIDNTLWCANGNDDSVSSYYAEVGVDCCHAIANMVCVCVNIVDFHVCFVWWCWMIVIFCVCVCVCECFFI